jgi:uncharacterized integral membrane protein
MPQFVLPAAIQAYHKMPWNAQRAVSHLFFCWKMDILLVSACSVYNIYNKNRKGCGTMQFWFIFSLLFSLIIAAFAVLNSETVTIKFFGINYQFAQSAVILVSAVFGAAIAVFLGLFGRIKLGLEIRDLHKQLKDAENKIVGLEETVNKWERMATANVAGKTAGNASEHTTGHAPAYTPGIAAPSKPPADIEQPELAGDE